MLSGKSQSENTIPIGKGKTLQTVKYQWPGVQEREE